MTSEPTPLDDFWEASSVSTATASAFASQVVGTLPPTTAVHPFIGPSPPVALRPVNDRLQRIFGARRSARSFGTEPLRHRQLERLLAAVGPTPGGRRTIPEAGGIDAVFTFAIARRVEGALAGRVVRYDHRAHAVADVGPVPDDLELRAALLLDDDADLPQVVLVFVIDLEATRARYGNRAGRFVLQQVGHAAQNVGLRLATERLHGYELGGGLDREVLTILGLAHTRARYGGAIACGR